MDNDIILGDILDTISSFEAGRFQLIVADPPYFLLNKKWDKHQWPNQEEYFSWCKKWFLECHRLLKPDGAIYIFQDWRLVSEFVTELKKVFPYFQNWITWERNKGRASKTNFKSSKEEILYFSKSNKPKFNEQKKIRPVIAPYKDADGNPKGWYIDEEGNRVRWTGVGNVWHYTPPVWSSIADKPIHPTQKPLSMLERIIEASSDEGDWVLDLFSGSGVASVASKKLKRNSIGVEKTEIYWSKAVARLNDGMESNN